MVNSRKGGNSQNICDRQPVISECRGFVARTEGRFHQGRPRKSASPAHSSSSLSFPSPFAPPLLCLEEPSSGASSLSLSVPGDLAPDLFAFLRFLTRALNSCSTSISSTKAASVVEAISNRLCSPTPVASGVFAVEGGDPGYRGALFDSRPCAHCCNSTTSPVSLPLIRRHGDGRRNVAPR